ncbi:23S rRNA (guanosine(2251)-2'-O)-methyltransferase RlmB [Phreatobacter cathodiphilus]|uniref:23S rRNA (Guanosine(2251)-2'-O)-methyltransferase RlmB n=1 Tax=Phreatobacter cathodiphilus TaxID=1868589 RepID=A0A2S0N9J8_9HYPH|nr:23S rRNA (guanosine(2251)-2'-O)-methyltransferase RlmB [Phreatobacter cathodiphilus]AVO44611.1 23S rRNA (guanosine(2251)-2'-O)-methyltransferase RlmB [Phreatobacter cathodiphilus]
MTTPPPKGPKKPFRPFSKPGKPFKGRGGRVLREPAPEFATGTVLLYGWHTVSEALRNKDRRIRLLLATENGAKRLDEEGIAHQATIVPVRDIDRRLAATPDAVHQGLFAEADALDPPHLDTMPAEGVLLLLDQITDPHNVGAIVRSAAAFGVKAIVTTNRHSPEATGVLAKSASGGLEHVPFVTVQNLSRAMTELKDRGFQVIGLDSEGETDLDAVTLREPVALVLGAEGKGLRQLTRDTCDTLARIDMPGAIKSLNVSNAAALALYAVTTRLGLRR